MKKNFMYAMMSAIALSGAVSFSACSSSEDVAEDVNPTYDGEAVKTQFSISLPFSNNATTRQAYSVVQEGAVTVSGETKTTDITKFRGMQDIVLIPFQNASNTLRSTRLGSNITLGKDNMLKPTTSNAANTIPSGQLLANSTAVLYKDVTIPVGTAGFLFYGKALGTDGFDNGSLTPTGLTGETSGITFTPTPIKSTLVTTKGEALATYVKLIAAAAKGDAAGDAAWWKCANPTYNIAANAWYNAGLGELYKSFISMKAGASSYVLAAVQDLYSTVRNNTDDVSVAIKNAINDDTYVTSVDGNGKLTFNSNITGYPGGDNNYMPDGAAALTWTKSATDASTADLASVPTAVTDESSISYGGMNLIKMSTITYPASLYYFVDSPIRVSNTSRENDYNGSNNWDAILATYSSSDGAVSSATRSVAITNPVQYAVGRLDVKVNALSAENYYDRKGIKVSKTYIPDSSAPETTAPAFELTGVLIGGQKAVGYDFTPKGDVDYTIYDKVINTENSVSGVVPTTSGCAGPTYTLALETAAETSVYVALEFLNKGADFQGYDGVVKHGCKFYMIAQLDPSNDVTDHVSGVANTGKRVFKQDFKTIANFTFGAGAADTNGDGASDAPGGFANAYVTIPDLRTPELELGLSVDLEWRSGIQFDVTF